MAYIEERKVRGKIYLYAAKSLRVKDKVHKSVKFLGKKSELSKEKIDSEMKQFALQVDKKLLNQIVGHNAKKYPKLEYPLNREEIRKVEEMNIRYKVIRQTLQKEDWEDVKKRFVANFVFESNALEGNSLTLKNFSEIVFENKIAAATDLREVHDARNSYQVFSRLLNSRKKISEKFIINLHKRIMKSIDTRTGYKKMPNFLLGRNLKLTGPKDVPAAMNELLTWHEKNKDKLYPLELAFKFHHLFEKIHPFADGNGRVGRMLLNYILLRNGYYPIIIRKTHRNRYLKSLQTADGGRYVLLMRFALEKAKDTFRKFFETYYQHL